MIKNYFSNFIKFSFLVLLQVLILDNVLFLGYVNPYLYILFIVFYPTSVNRITLLLTGFILGLCIDFFNDTGGVHAAATLIISYLRPFLLRICFGLSYDYKTLNISKAAIKQQLLYIFIIVFIHHLLLFSLEYFDFNLWLKILKNTIFSGIFSVVLIYVSVKLFNYK